MGKIYQHIGDYLPEKTTGKFVEIGSDRWEGSTACLDKLAASHSTTLITVDVLTDARDRLKSECPNTEFVVSNGIEWAGNFAMTHTDIDVLYLDNFDYIWDVNLFQANINQQKAEYAGRGVTMSKKLGRKLVNGLN